MKKITPLFIILIIHFYLPAHAQSWSLTGNAGTDAKSNFIGTTDDKSLLFRIRNTFSGIIDSTNRQTFFGYGAGKLSTAADLTAFGYKALAANTTQGYGTALGSGALSANTTGYWNTAAGWNALSANTTGIENTAVGMWALTNNTTGSENTAIGSQALPNNTTGYSNVGIGANSLNYNSSGYRNNAIGYYSLLWNTTGGNNVAQGYEALYNTTTDWNTGIGNEALKYNAAGYYNTSVGGNSLLYNRNAYYNTAIGYYAGGSYDLGYNNVFLGANTRTNGANYYNVIAIGQDVTCTAVSQARIGNAATSSIGGYVGWSNISDGRYKKSVNENVKGLEFILNLRPVTYQLDVSGLSTTLGENSNREGDITSKKAIADKEKMVYTGFIAQEVEAVAQKINFDFSGIDKPKNEKDLYGLRYAEFVVPLVKGMQEQEQQINKQQEQIDALQEEIKLLKEQNKLLRATAINK